MNLILTVITGVVLGVSVLIFLSQFLASLFAYRAIKKGLKTDQDRSEKGEVVLLKDSLLMRVLEYADKDMTGGTPPTDPLGIYSSLATTRWIFICSQIVLLFTLVGLGISLFLSMTGGESEEEAGGWRKILQMAFPMLMSLVLSIMMIIYIKAIYQKLYVGQIWPYILKLHEKLGGLHKTILDRIAPVGDSEFGTLLKTKDTTVSALHAKIKSDANKDTLRRRIITMSVREYFMAEVADYNNSDIRTLFYPDDQARMKTPGKYIRIDCSRTIQNYAYKHTDLLDGIAKPEERRQVLVDISNDIMEINKKIGEVRLESPPLMTLLENFFRISTYYFFFMTLVVLAILIGWYGWWCKVKRGWNSIKWFISYVKIQLFPGKPLEADKVGTDESEWKTNARERQMKALNEAYKAANEELTTKCEGKPLAVGAGGAPVAGAGAVVNTVDVSVNNTTPEPNKAPLLRADSASAGRGAGVGPV